MPASAVESPQVSMAVGEDTCTKESQPDQMPSDVAVLQCRLQEAEANAQQAKESLRLQGDLLVTWRRRISDQDNIIKRLKKEKDQQMNELSASLLLLEAELKKEQAQILQLLSEKEQTIAHQEQQIRALLVLNRKLSAALDTKYKDITVDKRRKSLPVKRSDSSAIKHVRFSKCSLHIDKVNGEKSSNLVNGHCSDASVDGQKTTVNGELSCNGSDEINESMINGNHAKEEEADEDINSIKNEVTWEHLRAVEESVRNYEASHPPPVQPYTNHVLHHHRSFAYGTRLEALQEDEEVGETQLTDRPFCYGSYERLARQVNGKERGQQLSMCYNRIMSNHRNVTKPKDVKYRKINRVKSRSLEELRGKLRNWTHPFFVSEKSS